MRIREILKQTERDTVTIDASCTVHEAICQMNQHRIGALLVTEKAMRRSTPNFAEAHRHQRYSWGGTTVSMVESQEICGIITERDIMRECGHRCRRLDQPAAQGADCQALVRDAMTKEKDLIIAVPDDDLDYAMRVMNKKGIKHLPILENGELVGIISLSDIIRATVEDSKFEIRMLQDYVQGRMY